MRVVCVGSKKGGPGRSTLFDNFRHYKLPRPGLPCFVLVVLFSIALCYCLFIAAVYCCACAEILCADNSHMAMRCSVLDGDSGRPLFDAIVCDPPYGNNPNFVVRCCVVVCLLLFRGVQVCVRVLARLVAPTKANSKQWRQKCASACVFSALSDCCVLCSLGPSRTCRRPRPMMLRTSCSICSVCFIVVMIVVRVRLMRCFSLHCVRCCVVCRLGCACDQNGRSPRVSHSNAHTVRSSFFLYSVCLCWCCLLFIDSRCVHVFMFRFRNEDLPTHPCLELLAVSEQVCRSIHLYWVVYLCFVAM